MIMDDVNDARKKRAQELREAAAKKNKPADDAEVDPEMLPGESPLDYTERRMRQRDRLKKESKSDSVKKSQ
jgi:hypothetical protein